MITIDMEKAKEIHRNELRKARDIILQKLDVDFMRAVESGDIKLQKEIATKKQELRDLTKHSKIEKAKNLDQLKAFWPDILKS